MSPEQIDLIANILTAVGLGLAVIGLFYNARQLQLSRRIAKGEFLLQFDALLDEYKDVDSRLHYGRNEYGPKPPLTDVEWERANRYISRIETLYVYLENKVLDTDFVDSGYSRRIVSIAENPELKYKRLSENSVPNKEFRELYLILKDKQVYQYWKDVYEERSQKSVQPIQP